MRSILQEQLFLYPKLKEQDVLKAVYQSVYGCGHFVYDKEKCRETFENELNGLCFDSKNEIEELGRYSRVHLSALKSLGILKETLLKLFILSAKEEDQRAEYIEILNTLPEICKEYFDKEGFDKLIKEHIEKGCPSLHHSDAFRENYHPAYRVILSEYADIIPLLSEIEKRENCIIAIDGKAASGKSTLALLLNKLYNADVIHMDDYFLPPEKKTKQRLSEIGGNVDHERFLSEVLIPLSEEGKYISRPYRCHGDYYEEAVEKEAGRLTVVEGSYSLREELCPYYDLKIFIDLDDKEQSNRIRKRNPEMFERFIGEWIPYENKYFNETKISMRCDVHLKSKKDFRIEVIKNEK